MITSAKKNYPNIEFMLCYAENGFADIECKFDVFSNINLIMILWSGIGIQA